MKCLLCGLEFDEPDKSSCSGCGKLHTCTMQRCPHCGYEMVAEPKLITRIRGLFK
ncbi:MAG: hypothetical protein M8352_07185 [ANME-2 cluster archaeon]|nr:hypothetical protein [ANME-2 cluster archaeon]